MLSFCFCSLFFFFWQAVGGEVVQSGYFENEKHIKLLFYSVTCNTLEQCLKKWPFEWSDHVMCIFMFYEGAYCCFVLFCPWYSMLFNFWQRTYSCHTRWHSAAAGMWQCYFHSTGRSHVSGAHFQKVIFLISCLFNIFFQFGFLYQITWIKIHKCGFIPKF